MYNSAEETQPLVGKPPPRKSTPRSRASQSSLDQGETNSRASTASSTPTLVSALKSIKQYIAPVVKDLSPFQLEEVDQALSATARKGSSHISVCVCVSTSLPLQILDTPSTPLHCWPPLVLLLLQELNSQTHLSIYTYPNPAAHLPPLSQALSQVRPPKAHGDCPRVDRGLIASPPACTSSPCQCLWWVGCLGGSWAVGSAGSGSSACPPCPGHHSLSRSGWLWLCILNWASV